MEKIKGLCDKRVWRGKDLTELRKLLEWLDRITVLETVCSADVELLSLKKGVVSAQGTLPFRRFSPFMGELPGVALPLENAENKERLAPLVKELKQNCLMLMHGSDKFFTADSLIPTMTQRIGAGGTNAGRPSFKRDAYFAELLEVEEQDVKMLIRSIDGVKKVFAMHSARYGFVPQTMILDIVDQIEHGLGKPVCKYWEVTNARTEVYLEFPEKAADFAKTYGLPEKIVPGLKLITSDVGESSVCAIGTWRRENVPLGYEVYTRKHVGKIEPDKVLEQISQRIFAKYDRIPKRLCELMKIEVDSPIDCVDSIFEQIKVKDEIGVRRMPQLQSIMRDQFNYIVRYTAFDVAMALMALPDMVQGLPKGVQKKFTDCIAQAVFADYEEYRTTLVAIPA